MAMNKLPFCATAALALFLACPGCDSDRADQPAAAFPTATGREPSPAVAPQPITAAAPDSCSGETQSGGECASGCDKWDEVAGELARRPIPANAVWQEIAVSGMVCGGCERRVIADVGQIEGVIAVEADAELGQVRVAMAPGRDLRQAAVDRINSLGYRAR